MAVASLTKFTVPLASDQSASAQGLLMPKLQYRFRVSFENFGVSTPRTELTKQVETFKRPSVNFGDVVLDTYNSKVKLIGKPEWQDVTVTFRDDAQGQVSKLIGEQLQKQFDLKNKPVQVLVLIINLLPAAKCWMVVMEPMLLQF